MSRKGNCLVVGHGAVGSNISARLSAAGKVVYVYDPAPRIAVKHGTYVKDLSSAPGPFDLVMCCIPAAGKPNLLQVIGNYLRGESLFLDWTSSSASDKRDFAESLDCRCLDVGLLDSIDSVRQALIVVVSGSCAAEGVELLGRLGFVAESVGDNVGDAAAVKLARSIFMKGLEALVLEFLALESVAEQSGAAMRSVVGSLGLDFGEFMTLLARSNRKHARRRALEIRDAASAFAEEGLILRTASTAAVVLDRAADAWLSPDAPAEDASVEVLGAYLGRSLCRQT